LPMEVVASEYLAARRVTVTWLCICIIYNDPTTVSTVQYIRRSFITPLQMGNFPGSTL
jgi:hypothetical protein